MRPLVHAGLLGLATLSAVAQAQTYKRFDKVEAETEAGFPWEKCYVDAVFPGAYALSCDRTGRVMVYDVKVRKPGGQPIAQTAAQPVVEGQWKHNDLVLASPTYLASSWELCAYDRPQGGGHAVMCGTTGYVVGNDWVRVDPDAPAAGQ